MSALRSDPDVVMVGGGLAGLACARQLQLNGISFQIIEASDGLGGRVRTDRVSGFLLDRGFQVLQTAYPEAQRVLDYTRLDLRAFFPGALIRMDEHSYRVADPIRKPLEAFEALFSPIGTMTDKFRLLALRQRLHKESIDSIFNREERTTLDVLQHAGFSPSIVATFFRPFLRGIFLEKGLKTSSRMFEFVYKMLCDGNAALPAQGMGAIPDQLASSLPLESIRLKCRVVSVSPSAATLESGEQLRARAVVVATEGPEACRLIPGLERVTSCSTTCMYFVADYDPLGSPILAVNGDGSGVINTMCVPSSVAPSVRACRFIAHLHFNSWDPRRRRQDTRNDRAPATQIMVRAESRFVEVLPHVPDFPRFAEPGASGAVSTSAICENPKRSVCLRRSPRQRFDSRCSCLGPKNRRGNSRRLRILIARPITIPYGLTTLRRRTDQTSNGEWRASPYTARREHETQSEMRVSIETSTWRSVMSKEIILKQVQGITFVAKGNSNHWVVIDGSTDFGGSLGGSTPKELLLMALAGCTATDVVSMLRKKRTSLQKLEIQVKGNEREEHPRIFTDIHVEYIFYGDGLKVEDIERAIELSTTKDRSVSAVLAAERANHSFV